MNKYSSAFIGTVGGAGESGYWELWYKRVDGYTYGPIARGNGNGSFNTGWIETDIAMETAIVKGAGYVASLDYNSLNTRNYATVTATVASGQGTVGGCGRIAVGDTCSPSFSPSAGYKLNYWTLDGSVCTSSFEVRDNCTVRAYFVKNEFTLSLGDFVNAKQGSRTLSDGDKVIYGYEVTLTATQRTGYTFDKFRVLKNYGKPDEQQVGSDIPDGGSFNMPNEDVTVVADFIHNLYDITCSVEAETAGTLTASAETAYYNDEITLETTANEGYYFAYYESDPVVSIVDNKFNMPPSDIEVTAVFYRRSTATLDKSAYTGGDTAVMTIDAENEAFTHKYILDFGFGMVSDETDVAAGVSTVNIYIPVAWSRMMASTPKTGGKLTLKTYAGDGTYVGSYEITGLSYAALNGTIPKLTVFRAKENGAYIRNGLRAGYHAAYPSSTSAKLICGNDKQNNPAASGLIMPGNKKKFALEETQIVELEITYGSETFKLTESVPAVRLVQKKVDVTVVSSS